MKFTGQIRIPDLDHPGVPATFLIEGTQAEVVLEGEESLGRWSLFDVQARRLISAAFEVEFGGEEVTFIADEPIDFAYRGLEEMASVWARFKSMNIVRRKVAVSRSRNGVRSSRIPELRAAMEENLGLQARSVSLPGTSHAPAVEPDLHGTHVWDSPARGRVQAGKAPPDTNELDEDEPSIPLVTAPREGRAGSGDSDGDEAASLADELEAIAAEKARIEEQHRASQGDSDEEAESLAAERKAIEEERARLAEERNRLEELHREAEKREQDRVEAFRLEMQRLEHERNEFERLEGERQQAHREAMERIEAERVEIEKMTAEASEREREDAERAAELQAKLAEMSQREQADAERSAELEAKLAEMSQREKQDAEQAVELQAKLAELEQERVRIEHEESERVEAARREIEALEEQQRRMESLGELREESPPESAEPESGEEGPHPEPVADEAVPAPVNSNVVDLAELEVGASDDVDESAEDDEKGGPKHLRAPERRRRKAAKEEPEPDVEPETEPAASPEPAAATASPTPEDGDGPEPVAASQPVSAPEPVAASQPVSAREPVTSPQPEPALAGAARQSGIMGAVRAAFGRGGREHVHDFVEAPGGLGIARSICRECGYVSISTED